MSNLKSHTNIVFISFLIFAAALLPKVGIADVVDDAFGQDLSQLCANQPAQELFKIATKKKNTDEIRRSALMRMMEVSRECAMASDQRLVQYHHKMIGAAHDVIAFSEEESRQIAVEAFQFVIQLPDEHQPPEGSISRGNKLSQIALTDDSVNIRLWALEALVTLRGNQALVTNTLNSAQLDSEAVVREMASDMLSDM